jgi:hypothetical protein
MRASIGKAGIAVAVFFLVFGRVWAEGGTGDLLQSFEDRKITIAAFYPNLPPSTKLWSAMEGFKDLTESEFLKLTGYEKEARKSSAHLALKRTLTYGGIGLLVGGLTYALIHTNDTVDGSYGPLILGGGVFLAGDVTMTIGGTMRRNTQTLGRATQITRDYNDTLLDRISDENASRKKK